MNRAVIFGEIYLRMDNKMCSQIVDFLDHLRHEAFLNTLEEKEIEDKIDIFLKDNNIEKSSAIPFLLKFMVEYQNDPAKLLCISLMLVRCYSSEAFPTVGKFFKSSEVSDKVRRKILLILDRHGETARIQEMAGYFHNKQNLAENALQSVFSYISASGEDKNNIFRHLAGQSVEFYSFLIQDLASHQEDQSTWILGVVAGYPDDTIARSSLLALGERSSPLAYEILENLLLYNRSLDLLREEILKKLRERGIHKPYQRAFIPHKCYLSEIDGHGNRILLISQRCRRSRMAMVTFMLNEEEGIKDCSSWADISSFETESLIKSMEMELAVRQVDYVMGVRILEDALWIMHQNKIILPASFLSVRKILRDQKLTPHPYVVDIERLGADSVGKRLKALIQTSSKLLTEFPFSEWGLDSTACHEFIKGRPSLTNGHKLRKGTITQFIKAVMEVKRNVWQRRFLMMADFLYQLSPRSFREKIDICLALSLAMKKEMPMKAIPFMVELAGITIEQILQKIHVSPETGE